MGYNLVPTEKFKKNFKKLQVDEKKQLKSKLEILINNPFHPSLRTKHLQGSDGLFEFSVNMDIRVIWTYDGDKIILLLDIGHHDVLNRY